MIKASMEFFNEKSGMDLNQDYMDMISFGTSHIPYQILSSVNDNSLPPLIDITYISSQAS